MTKAELCDVLGLSHGAVHHYLRGRVPRGYILARISKVLGVTSDELLGVDRETESEALVLWPLKAAQESLLKLRSHRRISERASGMLMDEFTNVRVTPSALASGAVRLEIEHKYADSPRGFPSAVVLGSPSPKSAAEAFVRFLAKVEEKEILFACVEAKVQGDAFFDQLSTPSAYAGCYAATLLVRNLLRGSPSELDARLDKLELKKLIKAHEDFLHEQGRLLAFYPEFYEFASSALNAVVARRLKLDFKPKPK